MVLKSQDLQGKQLINIIWYLSHDTLPTPLFYYDLLVQVLFYCKRTKLDAISVFKTSILI